MIDNTENFNVSVIQNQESAKAKTKKKLRKLKIQNFRCSICRNRICLNKTLKNKYTEVGHHDHCHKTGVYAGVLCLNCNTGLGQFKDSPELLRRAAIYLELYR